MRTKSKQNIYSNWSQVLLFDLAHKQCNGITEGQLHCLMSESKERFLANDILFGSAWCLVMAEIQFYLIKRNKDWTSRTLANPHPLRPITSHFCLTHMYITPKRNKSEISRNKSIYENEINNIKQHVILPCVFASFSFGLNKTLFTVWSWVNETLSLFSKVFISTFISRVFLFIE